MIAGYAVFSVIGKALAKSLQTTYDVSVFDLGWSRSVTGFIIALLYVPLYGQDYFAVPKELRFALAMRVMIGVFTFLGSEWVLQALPLSIAFIIKQMQPFFTALLSYFMLSHPIDRRHLLIMIISYIGVLIIADAQPSSELDVSNRAYKVSCAVQVLVAMGYSLMVVLIRQMKSLHFSVLQFNYFFFSMEIQSFLLLPGVHSKRPALIYDQPKTVYCLMGLMGVAFFFR
jgi:drug/metabolite transporter (DMT)-like permease